MCVKELILNGSDYNAEDEMGRTSLYIAAHCGFDECVLTHLRNAIGRDILSLPVKDSGGNVFGIYIYIHIYISSIHNYIFIFTFCVLGFISKAI